MGFIVPPPPITFAEFQRRKKAGARTLEDFDPQLAQWARGGIVGLLFRRRINKILRQYS
jgi:hypothetical protein